MDIEVLMVSIEGDLGGLSIQFYRRSLWVKGSSGCKMSRLKKRLREIEKEEGLVLMWCDYKDGQFISDNGVL